MRCRVDGAGFKVYRLEAGSRVEGREEQQEGREGGGDLLGSLRHKIIELRGKACVGFVWGLV